MTEQNLDKENSAPRENRPAKATMKHSISNASSRSNTPIFSVSRFDSRESRNENLRFPLKSSILHNFFLSPGLNISYTFLFADSKNEDRQAIKP